MNASYRRNVRSVRDSDRCNNNSSLWVSEKTKDVVQNKEEIRTYTYTLNHANPEKKLLGFAYSFLTIRRCQDGTQVLDPACSQTAIEGFRESLNRNKHARHHREPRGPATALAHRKLGIS
jgi:hypothetical protein